jgi:hypothetical protein
MKIRAPVQRGIGVGVITIVLYLTIVVITTPSLKPVDAIVITVAQNWWLIGGIAVGTGVQAFLLAYAKDKACLVRYRGTVVGASSFFSGFSSFLSFLALIPVGCCGTWIYVLSFLPGLIGAGASGFLIRNGLQFEFLGLVLMTLSVAYTYVSVRRKLAVLKSSQGRISPKTLHLLSLVLIAVTAFGSVIFLTVYLANFRPQVFKGAYAVYSGTAFISGVSPLNTTRTYEILDSNATFVKMQITTYLGTVRLQATSWEPYSAFTRLHSSGEVFVREYSAVLLINGRTYPNLIADEYVRGNSTVTYYYDSLAATFPIEIVTNAGTFTIELKLASTNQG